MAQYCVLLCESCGESAPLLLSFELRNVSVVSLFILVTQVAISSKSQVPSLKFFDQVSS